MAERHTKSRAPRGSVRSLVPMRPSRSVLLHSGWTVRTRGGSRTPNTPGLSRRPLPLGYPGGYAVLFVLRTFVRGQGRTRTDCLRCARAALYRVSYKPVKPTGRLELPPPGYESGAPPIVLRWHAPPHGLEPRFRHPECRVLPNRRQGTV